jgi:dephospho-CoA kinase
VAAVRARFGDGVLDAAGAVDRRALGPRAFAEEGGLAFLEQLVHGRVARRRGQWIAARLAETPPPPLLVCEVPVLFEAGIAGEFDAVVVVTASDAVRRARVEARGQDFDQRAARQMPEAEKVARADRAYVNDGDIDALRAWIADRYAEYSARPCRASRDE